MSWNRQLYMILCKEKDTDCFEVIATSSEQAVLEALEKSYRVFKFPFPGMIEITESIIKFKEEEIKPEESEEENDEEEIEED